MEELKSEIERLNEIIKTLKEENKMFHKMLSDSNYETQTIREDLGNAIATLSEMYLQMDGDIKNHHYDDDLIWNNLINDLTDKYPEND